MPVDHGAQAGFGEARVRSDGLDHLRVGVVGQPVADLRRQITSAGQEHAGGRARRPGEPPDLGRSRRGDPREQGRSDPGGAGQPRQHVQRHSRVVREPAAHVRVAVAGQGTHQRVVDRGIPGDVGPDAGSGVRGQCPVHPRRQIGAIGERPAQQHRGMVREADDGLGGRRRVLQGSLSYVVHGGLVGPVAGGSRRQHAVGALTLPLVHERRLLRSQTSQRRAGGSPCPVRSAASASGGVASLAAAERRTWACGCLARPPGGHVGRGPQRELRDDTHVRVRGQRPHHVGRETGAGGQLLPVRGDRVPREDARPLRAAGALVEQGESDVRPRDGIDVGGGQPSLVREVHPALRHAREQGDRLRVAEVRPVGETPCDVGVRDRDQPVDQLVRQRGVGGETAQDVIHTGHHARTVADRLRFSTPGAAGELPLPAPSSTC